MKFTSEIIDKLDDNNMKAKEILNGILNIIGYDTAEINGVDVSIMVDAAFDYVKANNDIFNSCK